MSTETAPIARLLPGADLDREDALARAYQDGHADADPRDEAVRTYPERSGRCERAREAAAAGPCSQGVEGCSFPHTKKARAFIVHFDLVSSLTNARDAIVVADSIPEALSRVEHAHRAKTVTQCDLLVVLPPAPPLPAPALPTKLAILTLTTPAKDGRRVLAIASLEAPGWRSAMAHHIDEGWPREQFLSPTDDDHDSTWRTIYESKHGSCYAVLSLVGARDVEVRGEDEYAPAPPSGPPASAHASTDPEPTVPPAKARARVASLALADVDGTVKYVRLETSEIRFSRVDSGHAHAALVSWAERELVVSAGKVFVDRPRKTVRMDERDSHSLSVDSLPGDEDARAIEALLFGSPVSSPCAAT